jgi:hypothetical protein
MNLNINADLLEKEARVTMHNLTSDMASAVLLYSIAISAKRIADSVKPPVVSFNEGEPSVNLKKKMGIQP